MPDYSAVTDVGAAPQRLFDYLSDVDNLPSYFSRMTSAEATGDDEVHVTADLGDRQVEADAWFRVDRDRLAIEWGSEGANNYSGHLEVSGREDVSAVTVTLHTEHSSGDQIQAGLEQTLESIRRNVEGAAA